MSLVEPNASGHDVATGHDAGAGARRLSPAGVVALVAAVLGLAVSIYLTVEHYSASPSFACPENATINCLKVTTSRWSSIAGVPVAVLGLAYYAAMVVLLALPSLPGTTPGTLARLRVAAATAGVLMVLWLVYVELFLVDAICLWCTAVHVLTLVVFGTVLWTALGPAPHEQD